MICTPIIREIRSSKGEIWHVWETEEVQIVFRWRDLRERVHLEDLGINGSLLAKWIIKKWNRATWTGLLWLRIETGGGLL